MRKTICFTLLLILTSVAAIGQQVIFFFPQIADGGPNIFRTAVILINNGAAVATGTIRFVRPDGTPFTLTLKDGRSGSVFAFVLQPKQTALLETTGDGPLRNGYAVVTADRTIGGTAIFSQFDAAGKLVTEAGVPASPNLDNFTIFVDTRTGFNTGLAIANTGATPSTLTFRLLNLDSSPLAVTPATLTLAPSQHRAQFVTEFAEFGSASANVVGSMEVSATAPVSAVTLRTSPSSLTTTPILPRPAAAKASTGSAEAVLDRVTLGEAEEGGVAVTIEVGDSPEPIQSFILRFMRGGALLQEQIETAAPGSSHFRFVARGLMISDVDQVHIRPVFVSGLLGKSSIHRK